MILEILGMIFYRSTDNWTGYDKIRFCNDCYFEKESPSITTLIKSENLIMSSNLETI